LAITLSPDARKSCFDSSIFVAGPTTSDSEFVADGSGAQNKIAPQPLASLVPSTTKANGLNLAGWGNFVGSIQQGKGVRLAAIDLKASQGFLAPVGTLLATSDVGVGVILMDGACLMRDVNNGQAEAMGFLDKPLIKPGPADGERGNLGEDIARKDEDIYSGVITWRTVREDFTAEFLLAVGGKIERVIEINIEAMSDGQKTRECRMNHIDGGEEFLKEDDVAVGVTEQVCRSDLARADEEIVQEWGAKFVASDVAEMMKVEFSGHFRNAVIFAEEKNIRARLEFCPASDGIPLDHADVPVEGLGHGKQRYGGSCVHSLQAVT
jgi:hypothetical protein